MAEWFEIGYTETIDDHLRKIAAITEQATKFWAHSHGWAPKEAAEILSKSRLDWLASFSRTLRARVEEVQAHPNEPAVLILAWAHLGTLVDGTLKLFLCVYLHDYLKDANAPVCKKGAPIPPNTLKFEGIKQFLQKGDILAAHHDFIEETQARRNAIHAFADKPIGTVDEYFSAIRRYRELLTSIETSLPYPYSYDDWSY
ncbi:MAG: hypothetical protein JO033_01550 [Acidobacteriaceae bacterium]|nr:hypothetical protein [Acidobacteriaceae bacterium]